MGLRPPGVRRRERCTCFCAVHRCSQLLFFLQTLTLVRGEGALLNSTMVKPLLTQGYFYPGTGGLLTQHPPITTN